MHTRCSVKGFILNEKLDEPLLNTIRTSCNNYDMSITRAKGITHFYNESVLFRVHLKAFDNFGKKKIRSRKITVYGTESFLKCSSEIKKTFEQKRVQSWRTKQTINFNEQSERFRFLHFGGLLLAEDKGSFVGPNLTKGPIGPVHSSTTRATRDFFLSALPSVYVRHSSVC